MPPARNLQPRNPFPRPPPVGSGLTIVSDDSNRRRPAV